MLRSHRLRAASGGDAGLRIIGIYEGMDSTGTTSRSASTTISMANAKENDLAVILSFCNSLGSGFEPQITEAGYTNLGGQTGNYLHDVNGTIDVYCGWSIDYKILGSAENSVSLTMTKAASTYQSVGGLVFLFRGADTVSPIDAAYSFVDKGAVEGTSITSPSVTPSTAGALVVGGFATINDNTQPTITNSGLNTYRRLLGYSFRTAHIGLGFRRGWVSGAMNSGVWSHPLELSIAFTFAIKPA